jgi:broad specificity phosphatase PhoE
MRRWLIAAVILLLMSAGAFAQSQSPWRTAADRHGYVVLLRHAIAPGVGDPEGFTLDDCSTQRNLSAAGRNQAQAIGERLRRLGFDDAPVYTSQWCRCRETANLLGLTEPRELPALNSFFGARDRGPEQMQRLREFLRSERQAASAVLVTHQVVISAVADVYPSSGEAVLARIEPDGRLHVIARLAP